MSDWEFLRLEQIAAPESGAISKPYGSAILREDYRPAGVPVVRGVNLGKGIFHDDDFVYIAEEVANKMPGARLASGDLVITHRGTVGQVSMIPRSPRFERYATSTSQVKVRLDPKQALPEFYYYWFSSPAGRRSLLEHASTVGVPGIAQPVSTIKRLSVPSPPIESQRAIAEVLGALDDKIAANTKLARIAFDFAAAVHETTLAHGSQFLALSAIATTVLGGTPSKAKEEYWAGGTVPWVNSGKANEDRIIEPSAMITEEALSKSAAKLMPAGTTLLAITGATLGQVARLELEAAGNQSLIGAWSSQTNRNSWLHFAIRREIPQLLKKATGAAQQHVNKQDVDSLLIPTPPDDIVHRAGKEISVLLDSASAADRESLLLRKTRDALLPQLMSGRLHIKAVEKVLAASI